MSLLLARYWQLGALLGLSSVLLGSPSYDQIATTESSAQPVVIAESLAAPGDIVARRGTSLNSRAVLLADGASRFSHLGIVVRGDGAKKLVVHSVPPDSNHPGGLRKEPLAAFLSEQVAIDWAIFRLSNAHPRNAVELAAKTAAGFADLEFDGEFDHLDHSKLYCTELVWLAYREAGIDLTGGELDKIQWPLLEPTKVILPSRVLNSAALRRVQ